MGNKKEIAETISRKVRELNISQAKLGEELGTSQTTISQIMAGNRGIKSKHARKLEEILGIPYQYIMYGTECEMTDITIERGGDTKLSGNAQLAGHDIHNDGRSDNIKLMLDTMSRQLGIIEKQQEQTDRLVTLLETAMHRLTNI